MSELDLISDKSQCFRYACGVLRQGKVDEAESAFERCLALASCLDSSGSSDNNKQRSSSSKSDSNSNDDAEFLRDVYLELGQLRNQRGRYQLALETFEKCSSLFSEDENVLYAHAQVVRQNATTMNEVLFAETLLKKALSSIAQKNSSAQEETSCLTRSIKQDLSFILCQLGRDEEARDLLSSLGFLYRLSREVLFYHRQKNSEDHKTHSHVITSAPSISSFASAPAPASSISKSDECCAIVDQALPANMLLAMQRAFARDSCFWTEHNYPRSGYFSYLHSLTEPASNTMDEMLRYLHSIAVNHFPHAKNARYAEWWAHSRPHGSGHQMHFDSDDEGRGGVHNPLVSSILYLTEGDVGGPTLVTDQQQQHEEVARKGWLVFPRLNRFAMFQGNLLHCVIPGRVGEGAPSPTKEGRRATFMVAFWDTVRPQMQLGGMPGASQLFPKNSKVRWPNLFLEKIDKRVIDTAAHTGISGSCTRVSSVWEDVDFASNAKKSIHISNLKGIFDYDSGFQGF